MDIVIEHLPKLEYLDVSFNKLTSFSQYELGWPQESLTSIAGNPFHCDCDLSWLIDKMACLQACEGRNNARCWNACAAYFLVPNRNRTFCHSPSQLNGLSLSDVSNKLTGCGSHQLTTKASMTTTEEPKSHLQNNDTFPIKRFSANTRLSSPQKESSVEDSQQNDSSTMLHPTQIIKKSSVYTTSMRKRKEDKPLVPYIPFIVAGSFFALGLLVLIFVFYHFGIKMDNKLCCNWRKEASTGWTLISSSCALLSMGQRWSTPTVLNEDSKDVATAAASELAKQMTVSAVQATAGAVVVGVGGAVAGAIAQVIFRGLWDTVFPPDAEESSTMDEMKSIVKQELKQDTLDQINGVLHDLFDMLTKDYTLDKESYAKIGLTSFLLLAGLRLALYQEMANVDPENEDPDFNPARSSRYATPRVGLVAQYAEKYAEHVEEWWPRILEDRRRAVVAGSAVTSTGVSVSLVGTVTEWIEDHAIRKDDIHVRSYSNIAAPPQPSLDTLLEEYRQQVAVKLSKKFNHPEEIATNWRKLIDKPINMTIEDVP
uniref:LRRCT domain-containing protein n=1 Tax=Branchiostoma floridae TaxID=7739 RepID=C3ZZE4_BRAFL|eukprot:XP_002586069.1 hypothetical protein BRAFLDRAFT_108254 [Branchiostoma floridae]